MCGEGCGRVYGVSGEGVGGGVGKCIGVWGEARKDVWGVKCCRVYGVSGEVCWRVGKGCGERNGGGVTYEDVGPEHTSSHISLSSFPSPFLHLPLPPTHPHTLSYTFHTSFHISPSFPHTPTHFPTIPTSLTFSKCGEVTM